MKGLLIALLLITSLCAPAQNIIRVMSYNVLNFPEPNPPGKEDTLAKIIEYHPVDILLIQELRSANGVDLILDNALNVNGETRFSAATWVPQQSNPNSSHKLQQMLFYDHEKFILHEETYALTERRDLNNYTLYLNDPDLSVTQDTTWLDIYVIHLKSSQGATNEQIRASMVDSLFQHIESKPADRNIIVAGDLNVYSSSESAYQKLINNNNWIVLQDPIDTPGAWNNNGSFAGVHTQSTRVSNIFNDGAGGGMDDRFDQALLSTTLMDGTGGISYVNGSYEALGNSGDCFNQSIIACDTLQTPRDILWSLYYMSDHLPVVFDLVTSVPIGIEEVPGTEPSRAYFGANERLHLALDGFENEEVRITVMNATGHSLYSERRITTADQPQFSLPLGKGPAGLVLISLESDNKREVIKTFRPK